MNIGLEGLHTSFLDLPTGPQPYGELMREDTAKLSMMSNPCLTNCTRQDWNPGHGCRHESILHRVQ